MRPVRGPALVPVLVAAALTLAACGGTTAAPSPSSDPSRPSAVRPAEPAPGAPADAGTVEDSRARSPFTGLGVDADVLARPALIVKIENSPSARPQSGLDAADVVIEQLVEGGITRFMVLFHSDLPPTAGPVRSARPVDIDLLSGLGPSGFAYSGARAEVRQLLASVPSVQVTEGAAGFFRDDVRRAPHNLYLRPSETLPVVTARGARPVRDIGWIFAAEPPEGAVVCPVGAAACPDPGASVVVQMSPSYRTGWTFDDRAGVYRRDQNGTPSEVTGGGRIGAANVVILATRQYVGISGYDETEGITDGAPAVVLRDGRRYDAVWAKPSSADLLLLRTPDGRPFPLRPGPTWIHLARADRLPTVG